MYFKDVQKIPTYEELHKDSGEQNEILCVFKVYFLNKYLYVSFQIFIMNKVKIMFVLAAILFTTNIISAQAKIDWKEKNRFHRSIGETFHPMEDGDFKPIRARSEELLKNAIAWQKSDIPTEYKDVKNIKETLILIVSQCKALDAKIKANASDEEIKKDLSDIHDSFHKIVGLCTLEKH